MPALAERVWEVVLQGPNGGILVTKEEDASSAPVGRLPRGALLRELAAPSGSRYDALGRRLHYAKVAGDGPDTGWVTACHREKDFAVRTYDVGPEELRRLSAVDPPQPEPSLVPGGARQYDIVLYGASGYTGSLAAEHLDAVLAASSAAGGRGLRWAVAGRSAEKLAPLARRCKTAPGVVQAASFEELESLAASSRVLVALAGPYALCGEAAVKACITQGTHYVDVTGETIWVHDTIQKYHEEAQRKGVMVIHFAAQVCAIDDINCYLLARKLGPLRRFREYFASCGGSSGGTFSTSVATWSDISPQAFQVYLDPFALGGRRAARPAGEEDADCTAAEKDPLFPALWLRPAYSSHTGARVIRRSCQLFEAEAAASASAGSAGTPAYGPSLSVTIREGELNQRAAEQQAKMTAPPRSAEEARAAAQAMQEQAASGLAPKPGQGPSPESRSHFFSDVYAVAESERGDWGYVRYTGPEAYEVTAMTCVTAALVLAEEEDKVKPSSRGGVLTPAFALHGSSFVERLQERPFANRDGRKMRFEIHDGRPTEEELKEAVRARMKGAMLGAAAAR